MPPLLAFRLRVLFEATGDIGLETRILTLGIERRTTALGRGEDDLRARIFKLINENVSICSLVEGFTVAKPIG